MKVFLVLFANPRFFNLYKTRFIGFFKLFCVVLGQCRSAVQHCGTAYIGTMVLVQTSYKFEQVPTQQ